MEDIYGLTNTSCLQDWRQGPALASGNAFAEPFTLSAQNGSASWDGTPTTFTYTTQSTPMPEAGSTLLFLGLDLAGFMILGRLTGILRRRPIPSV
jgi:hypothetical protein